ncbi:MAG: hypothetical protein M1608_14895 [Candidatus Omnitrophica bacterium]|nr:hypothetical protein [Candidatus Omnitrophota bacterium]
MTTFCKIILHGLDQRGLYALYLQQILQLKIHARRFRHGANEEVAPQHVQEPALDPFAAKK